MDRNRLNESVKNLRVKDPMVNVVLNEDKSAISLLRGKLCDPADIAELTNAPFDIARKFIRENNALLGDIDEGAALDNERIMTDKLGMIHVSFTQKYGNADVLGGKVTVHYGTDGSVYMLSSNLAVGIDVTGTPRISSIKAVKIAKKHAGNGSILFQDKEPVLVLADAGTLHKEKKNQKYYLCWRMRIVPPNESGIRDHIYLVDAIKGEILLGYSALQNIGTGYYSTGAALNSEVSGGTHRLRDTATTSAWTTAVKPVIHTYDDANAGNLTSTDYSEDADDNWDNGGVVPANRYDDQRAEVDIHRFLGYVLDYYYQTHGHNSWDGAGADLKGHAHNNYLTSFIMPNNAFWDPDSHEMFYGDGDGITYDFMTTLDVTGHECTHGVNDGFDIVQTYDGETGALNEALADLFGIFIAGNHPADDTDLWQEGEQCSLPNHRGRNIADPSRDSTGVVQYDTTSDDTKYNSAVNGYFPDHYSIRYTGDGDYHGVHINNPIITHAVYLMINGGTHRLSNITVAGIGIGPVEQILYRVISTGVLTNSSVFTDFRLSFISACKDLYPGNQANLLSAKTGFYAVGIGPDIGIHFIVERSTLGEDEIDARRAAGSAVVPDAFRVVVDGFSAAELGITGSGDTLNVLSPIAGMTVNCKGNISDSGDYGSEEQRFTFNYDLDFGADNTAFSFPDPTEMLTLNVTVPALNISASAQLELIKQPNPFILHGDPPWLSIDLRVFVVKEGDTRFGRAMSGNASDAPGFIQDVMRALTVGKGTAGGESFDNIATDQEASALYLYPADNNGSKVFNFALAKVHYIGTIGAAGVRVFFRLLSTQSTDTAYDISPGNNYPMSGNYRFWSDGAFNGKKIALAGIRGSDYVTIPCFSLPRVDTATISMTAQDDSRTDGSGTVFGNVQSITPNPDGSEVDIFFGCWLDVNQPLKPNGDPNNVIPITVGANTDGPFTAADNPLSIQEAIIRNGHQCLIAEIAFDPVEIPVGCDPSNWDKLAQRNLAWSDIGSAQAVSTFDIRPTLKAAVQSGKMPDELMIDWGNTPAGNTASIFLPAVNAADIITMADKMYATHRLELTDSRTLKCTTGGVTYIPIPSGNDVNYAGLLSIDFPSAMPRDQVFNITVRQVTNSYGKRSKESPQVKTGISPKMIEKPYIVWRIVLGAFQLSIPVKAKEMLLEKEERLLSVFRWIERAIPAGNRWYAVFKQYVKCIAKRVDAFGGNSGNVEASPAGRWREAVVRCRLFMIINAVLIALLIVGIGTQPGGFMLMGGVPVTVILALMIFLWNKYCRLTMCKLLKAILAGTSIALLILILMILFGQSAPRIVITLIVSICIAAGLAITGWLKGCFK